MIFVKLLLVEAIKRLEWCAVLGVEISHGQLFGHLRIDSLVRNGCKLGLVGRYKDLFSVLGVPKDLNRFDSGTLQTFISSTTTIKGKLVYEATDGRVFDFVYEFPI